MNLDKSKPYGVILGKHPAKYVQDGIEYGVDGKPINQTRKKAVANKPANPKSTKAEE